MTFKFYKCRGKIITQGRSSHSKKLLLRSNFITISFLFFWNMRKSAFLNFRFHQFSWLLNSHKCKNRDRAPSETPLAISMRNFQQICTHLIYKMHVWNDHVLVKFDMEIRAKIIPLDWHWYSNLCRKKLLCEWCSYHTIRFLQWTTFYSYKTSTAYLRDIWYRMLWLIFFVQYLNEFSRIVKLVLSLIPVCEILSCQYHINFLL